MLKLAKYLKPFILGLVMAIALLFIQAISDLNLPNYMSDIVNVGIQQNGIEHSAPNAISQEGMTLITTFMTDSEKQLVESAYTLVSITDKDRSGKAYNILYPDANQQLYVINEIDRITEQKLDAAFEIATVAFINVMQEIATESSNNKRDTPTEMIDITELYQLQPLLDILPEATIISAYEKAAANDNLMLKQSGIMLAKEFYDELGFDLSSLQTRYIIKIGLIMLLIAFIGGIATVLVGFLSAKIATGVARDLRREVFNKVESFSNKEFDKFSTASLITRCTNDITQIQMLLIMGIRMICYAPILAIGGIIMAIDKSPSMSWIIALAVLVLFGLILVVIAIAMPKFKIIQKLVDKLNLVSRENLSGLMVIRAFSAQNHEKSRFDKANKDLTEINLFVNRVMVFMMPAMMLIMNGITVLILWVGAHHIANSALQVGDMMAFMQYVMQIIMSFLMLSLMLILVPRAAVSAERIVEVLETNISIKDPINPKSFDSNRKGYVEFKNVYFRYNDAEEDALSNISFTAKPAETTAIIGSTGSGKSTIANLILRFYDVSEGQILVDGVDIRDVTQEELRSKIGYVPQKGVLLSGTIASNLIYGKKDASDDEISNAAKIAQAIDFISEKSDKFDSVISQSGGNVSGGQKQRLSIARALVKKPDILIFDDSFSALDYKTDSLLRASLKENIKEATVIVVAQRVSTIMNAEQIIVLDQGGIVGIGTHKELLRLCPEYYEIASSQLSKEELV